MGAAPATAPATSTAPHSGDPQGEAVRALSTQHDALVAACFAPLAMKSPEVKAVSFHLRMGFDAEGKQATKASLVPRNLGRPDITDCVARTLEPIQIPGGLGPATVDVVLWLP
jgi:hypothetical protein